MPVTAAAVIPSSSLDLFDDEVLRDPYEAHSTLREMGPAVYLHRHGVWALTRYEDVKAALKDTDTFSSVDGVALTDQANQRILAGTVLASDGMAHARLRRPLSHQLNPRAIQKLAGWIEEHAEKLVTAHVRAGRFDAVALARKLVADVVMELMGLPEFTRDQLIEAAEHTFNCFGPDNPRHRHSAPAAAGVIEFLHTEVTRKTVRPGTWMDALYQAADAGRITEADVVPLMSAYVAAGMDTTIFAISTAMLLLARHPQQWRNLRAGSVSAQAVFHETLRLESPVQGFGRRVTRATRIGNTKIKAGEQVWLLYGAANRDPRKWGPSADEFSPARPDAEDQLALGAGPHLCAGNHLAALETRSLLTALTRHCTRLEVDGHPQPMLNNTLRGYTSIPLRATPCHPQTPTPHPPHDTDPTPDPENTCARTHHRVRAPTPRTAKPRTPWRTTRSKAGACCATESCSSRTQADCCRTAGSPLLASPPPLSDSRPEEE